MNKKAMKDGQKRFENTRKVRLAPAAAEKKPKVAAEPATPSAGTTEHPVKQLHGHRGDHEGQRGKPYKYEPVRDAVCDEQAAHDALVRQTKSNHPDPNNKTEVGRLGN